MRGIERKISMMENEREGSRAGQHAALRGRERPEESDDRVIRNLWRESVVTR